MNGALVVSSGPSYYHWNLYYFSHLSPHSKGKGDAATVSTPNVDGDGDGYLGHLYFPITLQ